MNCLLTTRVAATSKWGKAAKVLKYGSRVLIVVGIGASAYEIYTAENKIRQTAIEAGGWTGALGGVWAGGEAGVAVGALGDPVGATIGGVAGTIVGGIGGFFAGEAITETAYDWFFEEGAHDAAL